MRLADGLDQAAGLRRLLGAGATPETLAVFGPEASLNAMACASLAFALAQRGGPVCVIDEAAGPRNVAGQFGLSPRFGLTDVLRDGIGLEDAMVRVPGGARLLRAEQGLGQVATTDERTWARLGDAFARASWAWVLLAAPAAAGPSLALAAPRRLLVLPARRQRLTEAYAMVKGIQQMQPDGRWQVLVMNATDAAQAATLTAALNDTARRFLGIEMDFLGVVPRDGKVEQAARAMRPLLEISPASPAATAFRGLAEALHTGPVAAGMDHHVFWQRLGLFGRLSGQLAPQQPWRMRHGRAYG